MHALIQPSRTIRLVLLVFCSLMLLPLMPASAQATQQDDTDAVTATATEISSQWEEQDLYDLYDWMHPDARNLMPRQAFLNWVNQGGLPISTPLPDTLDISFEEWTWPATGETYDDAAVISIPQQPEGDGTGTSAAGDWALVNDGQRWRWFPNLTTDEIDTLITDLQAEPETYEPTFRRSAYARIDRFWENAFAEAGLEYAPLTDIVAVSQQPFETGCGTEEEIELYAIYYCTADATVYYDPDFRDEVVAETGPYGWTMIISHEWAHHLQTELGTDVVVDPELDGGLYPIEIELQADCLAGVYAQDALARGDIEQDEVDAAEAITSVSGDTPGTDWDDFDAHGTSDQRVQSFYTGFEDGFYGCHVDLAQNAS